MSTVSPDEIRAVPARYAIGKRPLSILLGWGELTYTRLLDGNTPTARHAAELRRLIDDPAAYARQLETGRSRITDVAYTRSFRAVDRLLEDQGGARRAMRIFTVADRLCLLAQGDLTPSALQRLTYYAQGLGFAQLDAALFDDLPRAAASGPAYDRIRDGYPFEEIQRVGTAGTAASDPVSDSLLTEAELGIIDLAYERYGTNSGQALSRMSREETPWKKARKRADAKPDQDGDALITAKSMRKFFAKKR